MPHDAPSEPWLSVLNDLDAGLDERTELHCMGGFAIIQAYGLGRATADIDVLTVVPYSSSGRILDLEAKESALRKKPRICLDVVTVAAAPEGYAARGTPLFPGFWQELHPFVLEPHDLAQTKLERNFECDRADLTHQPISFCAHRSELLETRNMVIQRLTGSPS